MLNITIEISDVDQIILENDLLDIEQWVNGAIQGKISKCKKRIVTQWQQKLFDDPDVDTLPASTDGLVREVIRRSDYKNRKQRDIEDVKQI
jgi:hypothetical protein